MQGSKENKGREKKNSTRTSPKNRKVFTGNVGSYILGIWVLLLLFNLLLFLKRLWIQQRLLYSALIILHLLLSGGEKSCSKCIEVFNAASPTAASNSFKMLVCSFCWDLLLTVDQWNWPNHCQHSKAVFDAGIPSSTQSGSFSSSSQPSTSSILRAWSWKDSPQPQGVKTSTSK